MSSSYYITYGTDRLTFGGVAGSLAFEYTSMPMCTVSLVTDATASAYATATFNGQSTSWSAVGGTVAKEVPSGATLVVHTELPNYYRNSGVSGSGLSGFYSGKRDNYWRNLSASGYVTGNAAVTPVSTNTNNFTASGNYQSVTTNKFGQWLPHIVSSVTTKYLYQASAVSATYATYGAYGSSWTNQLLGSTSHFRTGVTYSGLSVYQSARFYHGKGGANGSGYYTGGLRIPYNDSPSTNRFALAFTGYFYRVGTLSSPSVSFTTDRSDTVAIYGQMTWNGSNSGSMSVTGLWSATGMAP